MTSPISPSGNSALTQILYIRDYLDYDIFLKEGDKTKNIPSPLAPDTSRGIMENGWTPTLRGLLADFNSRPADVRIAAALFGIKVDDTNPQVKAYQFSGTALKEMDSSSDLKEVIKRVGSSKISPAGKSTLKQILYIRDYLDYDAYLKGGDKTKSIPSPLAPDTSRGIMENGWTPTLRGLLADFNSRPDDVRAAAAQFGIKIDDANSQVKAYQFSETDKGLNIKDDSSDLKRILLAINTPIPLLPTPAIPIDEAEKIKAVTEKLIKYIDAELELNNRLITVGLTDLTDELYRLNINGLKSDLDSKKITVTEAEAKISAYEAFLKRAEPELAKAETASKKPKIDGLLGDDEMLGTPHPSLKLSQGTKERIIVQVENFGSGGYRLEVIDGSGQIVKGISPTADAALSTTKYFSIYLDISVDAAPRTYSIRIMAGTNKELARLDNAIEVETNDAIGDAKRFADKGDYRKAFNTIDTVSHPNSEVSKLIDEYRRKADEQDRAEREGTGMVAGIDLPQRSGTDAPKSPEPAAVTSSVKISGDLSAAAGKVNSVDDVNFDKTTLYPLLNYSHYFARVLATFDKKYTPLLERSQSLVGQASGRTDINQDIQELSGLISGAMKELLAEKHITLTRKDLFSGISASAPDEKDLASLNILLPLLNKLSFPLINDPTEIKPTISKYFGILERIQAAYDAEIKRNPRFAMKITLLIDFDPKKSTISILVTNQIVNFHDMSTAISVLDKAVPDLPIVIPFLPGTVPASKGIEIPYTFTPPDMK